MKRPGAFFADLSIPAAAASAPHLDEIPRHETAHEAAARRALATRKRHEALARQTPVEFAEASLDDLDAGTRSLIDAWLSGSSRTLVIRGGVGIGKTHTAFAAGSQAVADGLSVAAWTLPDLLIELAPDGDPGAAERVRQVELLILDDLGTEKTSEWRVEQLTAILDTRLREGRRQIVTTNLTYDDLANRYGERIMSRLTGGARVILLTGPDRRKTTW